MTKKYYRKTIALPGGGRKDCYAKTLDELEEKLLDAKLQLRAGIDLTLNPPFGEFAAMWYASCKKPYIQVSTQEYYKNVLNNHILPYIGNVPIREIRPMHIVAVMNRLEKSPKS